jgi:hypothetical protein
MFVYLSEEEALKLVYNILKRHEYGATGAEMKI